MALLRNFCFLFTILLTIVVLTQGENSFWQNWRNFLKRFNKGQNNIEQNNNGQTNKGQNNNGLNNNEKNNNGQIDYCNVCGDHTMCRITVSIYNK